MLFSTGSRHMTVVRSLTAAGLALGGAAFWFAVTDAPSTVALPPGNGGNGGDGQTGAGGAGGKGGTAVASADAAAIAQGGRGGNGGNSQTGTGGAGGDGGVATHGDNSTGGPTGGGGGTGGSSQTSTGGKGGNGGSATDTGLSPNPTGGGGGDGGPSATVRAVTAATAAHPEARVARATGNRGRPAETKALDSQLDDGHRSLRRDSYHRPCKAQVGYQTKLAISYELAIYQRILG
jgi:hypothetical protein